MCIRDSLYVAVCGVALEPAVYVIGLAPVGQKLRALGADIKRIEESDEE